MLKLLITGGTGLIGKRFIELYGNNYEIHILTREKKSSSNNNIKYHQWNVDKKELNLDEIRPDYILTLHGAGIADKRWSSERKQEIIDSRVKPLMLLKEKLLTSNIKPKAIIGAAAIGYYGDRPGEVLNENTGPGKGFLSQSCISWEDANQALSTTTSRSVVLRLGTVLSRKGGALPKMMMTKFLRIFNYFGNGQQTMSWIHIDDVCQVIHNAIVNDNYSGVINVVSPESLSNKNFITTIKNLVGSFGLILPVPAFLLKIILGEMSSILLDDTKVKPKRLEELNYEFRHSNIESALKDLL